MHFGFKVYIHVVQFGIFYLSVLAVGTFALLWHQPVQVPAERPGFKPAFDCLFPCVLLLGRFQDGGEDRAGFGIHYFVELWNGVAVKKMEAFSYGRNYR